MRERERITIRRSRGSVGCRRDLTSRRHASPLMIQREDSATNSNTVFCTPPHNTRSWGAVRAYWERIAELAKGSVKCLLDVAGGSLKTAKAETVAPEPLVESSLGLPRLSKTQGFFTNEPSVAIDPMLPGRGSTDGSLHMPPLPPDPYQSVLSESVAAVPGALPSGAGSTTTPAPQVVYNFYYMNSGSFNPAASPLVLSGQAHQPTFVVNSSTVSHGGGALLRQTIAQKRQRDREGKYEHTGANKLHKSRSDASLHVANVEVQNHLITNRRVEPNEIICAQNNTSNKKEFLDTAFQSATSRNDSVRDVMSIVKGGEMLPLKGTALNNGFARPGPPAVAFDDDGFASNAGSDDGDGEGDTTDSRAPTKPSFGTGVSGQASAFGAKDGTTFAKISFNLGAGSSAAPTDKPAVPSNPFSLGAGSSTAPADKPAVPSNPFSFGAGSSAAPADKPAVPSNPFSFGAGSSAAPTDKPAVPSNPFSLGAGSSAAPTDKPAVASNPFSLGAGSSTVAISGVKEATLPDASRSKVTSEAMPIVNNGFARPGPPAVAFDDDGFASNAGSDDGDGEGDTTDSRAPTKPSFGTGVSGQASAFGAKDGTTFAKISFNLGAGSSAAPTDKPAVPSNPFSLGAGSSTAPADKPAVPSNPSASEPGAAQRPLTSRPCHRTPSASEPGAAQPPLTSRLCHRTPSASEPGAAQRPLTSRLWHRTPSASEPGAAQWLSVA
ncbi:hypothetical protein ERJ75_001611200 [Trypanosoma vivax]|nr:hypothetical protein ERJ75_001611200 [Trypanosoma vivax]